MNDPIIVEFIKVALYSLFRKAAMENNVHKLGSISAPEVVSKSIRFLKSSGLPFLFHQVNGTYRSFLLLRRELFALVDDSD